MAGADDINWDDLRYFLRALEAKSLAGAARRVTIVHLSGDPTPFKADIMRENRT